MHWTNGCLFNDEVPDDFWKANTVYVAQSSLFSIKWAEKFGQSQVDGMIARTENAFADFEEFKIKILNDMLSKIVLYDREIKEVALW